MPFIFIGQIAILSMGKILINVKNIWLPITVDKKIVLGVSLCNTNYPMKKIGLVFVFLLFALFFITINVSNLSYAQETQSTGSAVEQINYELAYPGILPDSPLYFLKAIRDRLISILINDSLKKAEFDLLTSDKKANAAWYLASKGGKTSLVVDTFSKSNNYFSEGIGMAQESKRMGRDVSMVLQNMRQAVEKHQEVLKKLQEKLPISVGQQLLAEEKRLSDFEKSVKELSK